MDNLNSILLIFFTIGISFTILKIISKNSRKIRLIKVFSYLTAVIVVSYYIIFIFGTSKP